MTENLSLNCDTLARPCKNTNKQNEELKIAVKRLQQEQFSYSNLIKMPNTFKYLCELSVEQFNISWNCVQPYYDVLISPDALMSKVLGRDFQMNQQNSWQYLQSVDTFAMIRMWWHLCLEQERAQFSAYLLVGQFSLRQSSVVLTLSLKTGFYYRKCQTVSLMVIVTHDCTEFKSHHVSNLDLNSSSLF